MARKKKTATLSTVSESPALPTLMDHLRELQGRLFSTVLVFILVAGAAYPFFGKIADIILAPLDKSQELVYLTPGGAFSFIIKVCVYIGAIGALPMIIYHVYRFVMPAVKPVKLNTVLLYTISSLVLAAGGIVFAYYVSLPASLYFLTGFNLYHINPMLTIDSYFSFVMTYLLAGALLFQLPLIMMIINSVTPLTPKKLMKQQDKIIIGSFIVAAVISPTPDALNQTLLASPMIVMYQFGVIMIWWKNRRAKKRALRSERAKNAKPAEVIAKKPASAPRHSIPRIAAPPPEILLEDMLQELTEIPVATRAEESRPTKVVATAPKHPVAMPPQPKPAPVIHLNVTSHPRTQQMRIPSRSGLSPFVQQHPAGRSLDGLVVPKRI